MANNFTLQSFYNAVNNRILDTTGGTFTTTIQLDYLHSALRRLRLGWDLPKTEVISSLTVLRNVFRYAPPSDYKDDVSLLDQFKIQDANFFRRVDATDFWEKAGSGMNLISEENNGTARSLLVAVNNGMGTQIVVHNCDSFNGNGTWTAVTATTDANNVATDSLYFMEGQGAVKFDIVAGQVAGATTANIFNSTMSAIDLSGASVSNIGTMVVRLRLPSAINFTSFTLRWGTNSSNYYEQTVTTQFNGNAFTQGWQDLGFDWATATKTGTPTNSNITYLLFRATFPSSLATQTGVDIDFITMCQKIFKNLTYSSDFLVVDGTTGLLKEEFASVSDTLSYINVNKAFSDWLVWSVLEEASTNVMKDPDKRNYYMQRRMEAEADLNMRWPSRRAIPVHDRSGPDDVGMMFSP